MANEKGTTRYPSIDKPWLKYYSEEAIKGPMPTCSVYEYMHDNNVGYEDRVALDYYGRKIRYGEMFENIDKAAVAYYNSGIHAGDVVVCIAPSLPEVLYSFYAVNRIGAVSDYFDPRTEPGVVYDEMVIAEAKAVIIFEELMERFADVVEKAGIPLVIVVSAKDSLPVVSKALLHLKGGKHLPDKWIPFSQFVKENQKGLPEIKPADTADMPAIMEHTGGTTGLPKAVVLSNRNVNAVVHQYRIGGTPLEREHSWLSVAFPFTAYSLVFSQHGPLSMGMCCGLCYETELNKVENMLLNGKYNHMANTPVIWERLMGSDRTKQADLSFLINPSVGADSMNVNKEKEINIFLEEHGCKYPIIKGYGMTEVGSAVSVCLSHECSKIGSVGIPFVAMNVTVVDLDTGKELPYGEQGEICMSGPSVMLGYFKNQAATEEVLKVHEDGQLWMHSGDLGHMDEDGFIFIDGRIKRMIIDHHGFKIFAPHVEQALSVCESVEKCCVVGAPDKQYGAGQIAVAYVILKQGCSADVDELKAVCEKEVPSYCVPSEFMFVDEFPYTSAAKVDYRALERLAMERKGTEWR